MTKPWRFLPPDSFHLDADTIMEEFNKVWYLIGEGKKSSIRCSPRARMSWYHVKPHAIVIGLKGGLPNIDELRRIIIHETLHALGLRHNRFTRLYGYCAEPSRDTLSYDIERWLFHKGPKPVEFEMLLNMKSGSERLESIQ